MLSAGVLGDYLSKRRAQGVPLWASDSARKQRECVAPLPELFFTPQPHREHMAPVAPLPLFLNCGFHHHHLPLVLSQILPCASKLECSLEICLGHSPIPRHLLLPSSECLPYRLASTVSAPGFPALMAWLLPQLARHHSCREPQAIPGFPLLSPTPPARHVHYQSTKNST